jgi:hypothetical protein
VGCVQGRPRLGLFVFERELPGAHLVRVYPREERLREIVRPRDTQAYVGNLVARQKGEGIGSSSQISGFTSRATV